MLCPYCTHAETKVIDKRDVANITKRRRECLKCKKRFNTHESLEEVNLRVIKKDGRREDFDREKLRRGLVRACEKRPISSEEIENMIANIEQELLRKGREVDSISIGDLVSKKLKRADKVAYIRFASVYREFADISDFKNEIKELIRK
jgi:transcriptional repressor NrdR